MTKPPYEKNAIVRCWLLSNNFLHFIRLSTFFHSDICHSAIVFFSGPVDAELRDQELGQDPGLAPRVPGHPHPVPLLPLPQCHGELENPARVTSLNFLNETNVF